MTRLLFVCLGNICRSPAAEGVMRARAAGLDLQLDSAGLGAWHVGAAPDARMQAAALARGYDLSAQRARQVSARDFHEADLILAMDEGNMAGLERRAPAAARARLAFMLDFAPPGGPREVPDPYYGGEDGFDHVLDLLEPAADGLLARLRPQG